MALKHLQNQLLRPFRPQQLRKDLKQAGMTLIEILLVIGLLGTIMTLVVSNLVNIGDDAKNDTARLGMQKIDSALQMYKIHNYRFPTTEQGLNALASKPSGAKRWRGPYLEKNNLRDPWDNEYAYESDGRNFKIISPGVDGVVGNEDDIVYPEEEGDAGGEF